MENLKKTKIVVSDFVTPEYDETSISNNIQILLDYGYIEATYIPIVRSPYKQFIIHRITAYGYDYLDAIRDNTIWNKTKSKISSLGMNLSLDMIKDISLSLLKAYIGI